MESPKSKIPHTSNGPEAGDDDEDVDDDVDDTAAADDTLDIIDDVDVASVVAASVVDGAFEVDDEIDDAVAADNDDGVDEEEENEMFLGLLDGSHGLTRMLWLLKSL